MLSARLPSVDSSGTSSQHARASSAVPLFGWDRVALSGPPPAGAMVEASADDGTIGHRSFQVDPNRFNSPPLVMLATGNARMAMFKLQRQSFMLHSVVHAVSLKMLEDVLLEAAELHKLEPHRSLLRLRAAPERLRARREERRSGRSPIRIVGRSAAVQESVARRRQPRPHQVPKHRAHPPRGAGWRECAPRCRLLWHASSAGSPVNTVPDQPVHPVGSEHPPPHGWIPPMPQGTRQLRRECRRKRRARCHTHREGC